MADAAPLANHSGTVPGKLSRETIDATLKLALAQHQRGELTLADALYGQVLAFDPDNADALHLKGIITLARGAPDDALALLEKACRIVPRSPLFHRTRADALGAVGRWSDACAVLKKAIALKPDWAEPHATLGIALAAVGKSADAKRALAAATKLDPNLAEAWTNLGVLHLGDKNASDAAAAFTTAVAAFARGLKTGPALAQALNGLGVAQTELARHDDALETFARALAAVPQDSREAADVLTNRAVTLQALSRWGDALIDLRNAGAIAERGPIWRNMAKSHVAMGAIEDADAACTRALALDPSDTAARYERSFARLLAGNLINGFDDYRYRPTVDRARIAIPTAPLPADLTGRRFRLVLEQGLGEHLFFLRYAPLLAARGAALAIEADPKLLPLIRGCTALPNLISRETTTPGFEPLFIGDLPYLIGANEAPPSLRLDPDPALRENMAARLLALGPAPYIAITWRAGIQDGKSLSKTIPLEHLADALKNAHGTLISIQRGPSPGETEALATLVGRAVHDFSAINDDLTRMLALLAVLDDYVGVSNTNMHLRAALRHPVRVLVPHPPEFRWLAHGERSPWFPEFTVYRAAPMWGAALDRLAADLRRGWAAKTL